MAVLGVTPEAVEELVFLTINRYHRQLLIPSVEVGVVNVGSGVGTLTTMFPLLVFVKLEGLLTFRAVKTCILGHGDGERWEASGED